MASVFYFSALIIVACFGFQQVVLGEEEITEALRENDWVNLEASDVCLSSFGRRNHKDIYADVNDCHGYFQCFFFNETSAIGLKRRCPPGLFWHDDILQCVPESLATPCQDPCRQAEVALKNCYADPSVCSRFYVCSNGISYPMCCPLGTSFNASLCICQTDLTCFDQCALPERQTPTTPSTITPETMTSWNNGTFCQDSYGNILKSIIDRPSVFTAFDVQSGMSFELNCAPGSEFDLETCRCNNFTENYFNETNIREQDRQCLLYLPFDSDYADQSVHRFKVLNYGYTSISRHSYARGSGALFVDDGWLEVPGLKTIDLGRAASFCFFYRCNEGVDPLNPTRCTRYAGLLSNNKDLENSEFSVVIASAPSSTIVAMLRFQNQPGNDTTVTNTVPVTNTEEESYTHVCLVYDGANVNLYLNNELVSSTPTSNGTIKISHSPYAVGSDQSYGDFQGFIDELLICQRALTKEDVNAHWEGRGSLFAAGLIPSPPSSSAIFMKTPNELNEAWAKFKSEFGKKYKNADEETESKARFIKKYKILLDHNVRYKKGLEQYQMTMYSTMDVKWTTFASNRLGYAASTARSLATPNKAGKVDLKAYPVRKDWRKHDCVNEVRFQGECGACYSFATTAAIEGQYCAKYGKRLEPLSTQQLIDCTTAEGNAGCAGGLMRQSYEYYMSAKRFHVWTEYPYVGFGDSRCRQEEMKTNVPLSIARYVSVPQSEDELLKAVALYGTIACAIDVTDALIAYNGGVFYNPTCTNNVNHAIAIVGYGCTRGNDHTCQGTKYWILRNSWGPQWGENGYMRIARNVKRTCGVETLCSYVIIGDNGGNHSLEEEENDE